MKDFNSDSVDKTKEKNDDDNKEVTEEEITNNSAEEWSEDFIRQAAQQFESNLANRMLGTTGTADSSNNDNQIQEGFQKMAEAAQQILSNPGADISNNSNDIAATISQTLHGLSQGAEDLQNPFSEADIMNMFSGGGGGEQNAFLPFMQGMMQSLLSKEVLYPSLKDILEKFPSWLEENNSKLTTEEKEKYQKQIDLMRQVCQQLETETESDTADVKRERFENVLKLMQKLQDYGQPPTELVGDVGPGLQFDPQGNPEQCILM